MNPNHTGLLPRTALRPKLFTTLKGYTRAQFYQDAVAGIIVGVVALPLAIAFAIASGVTPERGLITAVVAGFIISALGGSRVQIGGPTGAFVVIVYGIVARYGLDGLAISTLMAGAILIIMGIAGFGSLIRFIPHPVTVGFTSGIAVLIFSQQIRDLLGLQMTDVPADFFSKWSAYFHALPSLNFSALGLAIFTVVVIIAWPRVNRRIPGSLIALILTTAAVHFWHLPVETIGSRFGALPSSLPHPHWPVFDWEMIKNLVLPATSIALLAGIESLLSASVSDGMIGGKHRSNMELVAQGVANVASVGFGGIPATGAIARTVTNVRNGGRTPIAGIIHACTLLLILLVFGKWAAWIPLSTLAGVLIVVAYNMSEWRTFRSLLSSPRSDVLVLLTTFGLTVVVDLTVAIEVGMVTAILLFIKQMGDSVHIGDLTEELREESSRQAEPIVLAPNQVPDDVEVFEISGAIFFGAAQRFEESLHSLSRKPRVMILHIRYVTHIDSTGIHALSQLLETSMARGIRVMIAGAKPPVKDSLTRSGLVKNAAAGSFFPDLDSALAAAAKR